MTLKLFTTLLMLLGLMSAPSLSFADKSDDVRVYHKCSGYPLNAVGNGQEYAGQRANYFVGNALSWPQVSSSVRGATVEYRISGKKNNEQVDSLNITVRHNWYIHRAAARGENNSTWEYTITAVQIATPNAQERILETIPVKKIKYPEHSHREWCGKRGPESDANDRDGVFAGFFLPDGNTSVPITFENPGLNVTEPKFKLYYKGRSWNIALSDDLNASKFRITTAPGIVKALIQSPDFSNDLCAGITCAGSSCSGICSTSNPSPSGCSAITAATCDPSTGNCVPGATQSCTLGCANGQCCTVASTTDVCSNITRIRTITTTFNEPGCTAIVDNSQSCVSVPSVCPSGTAFYRLTSAFCGGNMGCPCPVGSRVYNALYTINGVQQTGYSQSCSPISATDACTGLTTSVSGYLRRAGRDIGTITCGDESAPGSYTCASACGGTIRYSIIGNGNARQVSTTATGTCAWINRRGDNYNDPRGEAEQHLSNCLTAQNKAGAITWTNASEGTYTCSNMGCAGPNEGFVVASADPTLRTEDEITYTTDIDSTGECCVDDIVTSDFNNAVTAGKSQLISQLQQCCLAKGKVLAYTDLPSPAREARFSYQCGGGNNNPCPEGTTPGKNKAGNPDCCECSNPASGPEQTCGATDHEFKCDGCHYVCANPGNCWQDRDCTTLFTCKYLGSCTYDSSLGEPAVISGPGVNITLTTKWGTIAGDYAYCSSSTCCPPSGGSAVTKHAPCARDANVPITKYDATVGGQFAEATFSIGSACPVDGSAFPDYVCSMTPDGHQRHGPNKFTKIWRGTRGIHDGERFSSTDNSICFTPERNIKYRP